METNDETTPEESQEISGMSPPSSESCHSPGNAFTPTTGPVEELELRPPPPPPPTPTQLLVILAWCVKDNQPEILGHRGFWRGGGRPEGVKCHHLLRSCSVEVIKGRGGSRAAPAPAQGAEALLYRNSGGL